MVAKLPDLVSVAELAREMSTFPETTIRDLIYHSQPRVTAQGETIPANGFASCIVRVGRRVLIDRAAFAAWLEKGRAS